MRKIIGITFTALALMSCSLFGSGNEQAPTAALTPTPAILEPQATPSQAQNTPVEPTATDQPTREALPPVRVTPAWQVDLSQPVKGVQMAHWQPGIYRADLDRLPIAPERIRNPGVIAGLTEDQRDFLMQNGFVVAQTGDQQFADIRFSVANRQGQPYYLTTDAAYHALHLAFDELLKSLERESFYPAMTSLTRTLLDEVQQYRQVLQGTPAEADAELAAAYLAVALKLFEPEASLPAGLEARAAAQLDQIKAAAGRDRSALFPGFEDDYGAYKPVGHYANSPTLERYFQGMTWYGRVALPLAAPDPNFTPSRVPLIITLALRATAAQQWGSIHQALTYLIGPSDDPGPLELAALMDQVYGPSMQAQDLADEAKWQQFLAQVDALPAPQINSTFVNSTAELQATRDWRLMGQRFTLDAFIFQNLIYDQVGSPDHKRQFPSGLDVMAVFGSKAAYQAQEKASETRYRNYPQQVEKLRQAAQAQPESEWLNRFYSAWLYAFIPQVAPKTAAYPPYMQTEAWSYKDLNSALGSFAELKHDTVLYNKMPEFMGGGGPPGSGPAPAYVEPNPDVFYRLAYLADSLYWKVTEITARFPSVEEPSYEPGSVLPLEMIQGGLDQMGAQLRSLGDIAVKELSGQPLTGDDFYVIQSCLGPVECLPTALDEPQPIPVVAAVSGAEGEVLEIGVGTLDRLYAAVPINGELHVAQGGVFSYYEFRQARSERLTDEEWRRILVTTPPPRLDYAQNFTLPGGQPAFALAFRLHDIYLITEAGGTPPLNLRAQPTKSAGVLAKLETGTYIEIIAGPVQADSETWWKVQIPYDESVTGWVAENPDWYERAYGQ